MNDSLVARVISVRKFENALNKGVFRQLFEIVRYGTSRLIPFDEVQAMLGFTTTRSLGRTMVPLDKIIGSEGRPGQFTRSFLPRSPALKNRWASLYSAFDGLEALPPVQLYELGGCYFVRDGNHRISVARSEKLPSIEAEVVSIDFPGTLVNTGNLKAVQKSIKKVQREDFFRKTSLPENGAAGLLETTFLLGYEKLYRSILGSGLEPARWYETVFLPAVDLIEREKLTAAFPGRTRADVFLLFRGFLEAAGNRELAEKVFLRQAGLRKRSARRHKKHGAG